MALCSDADDCSFPQGRCAPDGKSCICSAGWFGEACREQAKCAPDDSCTGHGQCVEGRCACESGWGGDDCGRPLCPAAADTGVLCSGRGKCFDGTCECFDGYAGAACEIHVGCPGGCSGHGVCRSAQCECDPGWTGVQCENRACEGGCNGRGRCENGECVCFPGWLGLRCESKACPGNGCSGNGRCVLATGKCECGSGWQGEDCSIHRGCPDNCLAHLGRGHCVGSPGVCACAEGFVGDGCGEATAAIVVKAAALHLPLPTLCSHGQCGPHGRCDPSSGVATCICEPGWRGARCDLLACTPSVGGLSDSTDGACGPHGVCLDGACRCDAGFVPAARGLYCERECAVDCHSPFGMCVDGVCACAEGRTGEDCTGVLCPNDCSGRGTCGVDGRCTCFDGFGGTDCSVALCASNCSGHGVCSVASALTAAATPLPIIRLQRAPRRTSLDPPLIATCLCDDGWSGPLCETPWCPSKCSDKGVCMPNGRCACFDGWKGRDCTERRCPQDESGNECSGLAHGQCGKSGRCRCRTGWSGASCERPSCPGSPVPCSARGPCIVDAHHGTAVCACEPPYTGPACEAASCPGNCSGAAHGRCIQPPDARAGACACTSSWRGVDCSRPRCQDDCSGRGDCADDGKCICAPGWGGRACEVPICPGDAPSQLLRPRTSNASVAVGAFSLVMAAALRAGGGPAQGCGPHGTCDKTTRACICAVGWTGADCSRQACPGNCNGRGICGLVTPGVCACDPFFTGEACEAAVACASGCNNHGTCDALSGRCVCQPGWSGSDCEHESCPVGPNGEPPCHGRGRCLSGVCECDATQGAGANCRVAELPATWAVGSCLHGCNGHGSCNATIGACVCEPGWAGQWCQHKHCAVDCVHGTCVHGVCACDPGWEGVSCELQQCLVAGGDGSSTTGCGSHGDCIQPAEPGTFAECRCHRGYAGADCSEADPHPAATMYAPAPPPARP